MDTREEARAAPPATAASWVPVAAACHLERLWIRHNGDVHCCYRWSEPAMRIAHIDDPDLIGALRRFHHPCSCERAVLRAAAPGEALAIRELVVEVSLTCQGVCAFCCVKADEWRGTYDLYDSLTRAIGLLQPAMIVVQGGEVLVQKRTLAWLAEIRSARPDLRISLVTNGNVRPAMADVVERLFDEVKVSIFGFEPATYERISGMKLPQVVAFAEALAARGKVELVLKYVVSPLNFHEADLFLDWAVGVGPKYAFFEDVGSLAYLNTATPDRFWQKMSERTGRKVAQVVRRRSATLRHGDMKIAFSGKSLAVLGLGEGFRRMLEDEGLGQKVKVYWAVGETPLPKPDAAPPAACTPLPPAASPAASPAGLRGRVVRAVRRFLPERAA